MSSADDADAGSLGRARRCPRLTDATVTTATPSRPCGRSRSGPSALLKQEAHARGEERLGVGLGVRHAAGLAELEVDHPVLAADPAASPALGAGGSGVQDACSGTRAGTTESPRWGDSRDAAATPVAAARTTRAIHARRAHSARSDRPCPAGQRARRSRTTPARRVGDGIRLLLGRRLDHDPHERLGARLAQQHPAGPVERGLLGAHGRAAGPRRSRPGSCRRPGR